MTVPAFLLFILLVVIPAQTNAAEITQVFEFDNRGSFEVDGLNVNARIEHYFDPFDASLGTLTEVAIIASATSQANLEQFQCAIATCTVEFLLDLVLTLEPGESVVDEAGNFTTNTSGVHFGGLASVSFPSISTFSPVGWAIDDFYTTPVHYLAFYNWRCFDCSSVNEPLLVDVRGSATLTYEYTPSALPAPSTLILFSLGFLVLRRHLRPSPAVR
ncbi:MAG: hypothetical protein Hals2KO_01390 [Halioglobus sp.]